MRALPGKMVAPNRSQEIRRAGVASIEKHRDAEKGGPSRWQRLQTVTEALRPAGADPVDQRRRGISGVLFLQVVA